MAKTKALISFAVTAKLICVFVFADAKSWFSHDAVKIIKANFLLINVKMPTIELSMIKVLYPLNWLKEKAEHDLRFKH